MGYVVKAPVKWAGGKTQLLIQYMPLFPNKINCLIEPFFGGGAVFFYLTPHRAVLIDNNEELINFYMVVKHKLELLLTDLQRHENTKSYYYLIRGEDPASLDDIRRASRFLFLNRTCFNGLYRVNSRGQFNVPFGRYKNPRIIDEVNLRRVSAALQEAEIMCADFSKVLDVAGPEMFVYCDPPYHPLSKTANFTSYTADAFKEEDQRRLADVFRELDRLGCKVMLSNSDTPFIRELYEGYDIRTVTARRAINCKGSGRGPVSELVIRNYGC